MQIVKFLVTAIPHYAGEIAGLQEEKAVDFLKRGIVEYVPMKEVTFSVDYHSYKAGVTYGMSETLADTFIKQKYCIEKKGTN